MKQVCWHWRRSKAYRGLPEARHGSLKVAAHVLGTFHCFVRKVKKMPIEDIHLALVPNPRVLLVPVRLLVQFRLQVGRLLQ